MLNLEKIINKAFGFLVIYMDFASLIIEQNYEKKDSTYSGKMIFDRTLYVITYKSKSVIEGLGDKFIKDKVIVEFKIVLAEK